MKEKIFVALVTMFALLISMTQPVFIAAQTTDQTQQPTILKSQQGMTTRGAPDPNIKQGMKPNDPNNPAAAITKTKTVSGAVTELKANAGTPGGAADLNIKKDMSDNVKNKPLPTAPRRKGGKTRGGEGCEVRLDNSTGWNIKIYVDGTYRGAMGGYDDATVNVGAGLTKVYARADFTDGTYKYWGPQDYKCLDNQYINFRMVP